MAEYINFEVGQKFPLPIRAKGDGGLFQVDADGMLFILQLSRTDAIAREAFRTGEMRFAFLEEDGILFLLYQIDGIRKSHPCTREKAAGGEDNRGRFSAKGR